MTTATNCEFMERRYKYRVLVEVCGLNQKLCMVDPATADWRQCTRRLWALERPNVLNPAGDNEGHAKN